MSERFRAEFRYLESVSDDGLRPETVKVEGAMSELAAPILREALRASGVIDHTDPLPVRIVDLVHDAEDPFDHWMVFVDVDETSTLADVARVFRSEVDDRENPEFALFVNVGGDQLFPIIWESLSELGAAVAPYGFAYQAYRKARKELLKSQNRRARTLVQEWANSGSLPPGLVEIVQTNSWWHLSTVEECFGLDAFRAAELLRAGDFILYESFGPDVWLRRTPNMEADQF